MTAKEMFALTSEMVLRKIEEQIQQAALRGEFSVDIKVPLPIKEKIISRFESLGFNIKKINLVNYCFEWDKI